MWLDCGYFRIRGVSCLYTPNHKPHRHMGRESGSPRYGNVTVIDAGPTSIQRRLQRHCLVPRDLPRSRSGAGIGDKRSKA